MKYKDKSKCHVRHNYITKHYSAIIGEDKDNYEYKGLSHENYRNKKVKLNFNPNKNDKRIGYIIKNLVLVKREILEEENHGNLINVITINYKH